MNEIDAADEFVGLQKRPVGEASWVEGNRPSRFRIEWPLLITGASSGGRLIIQAETNTNPLSYAVIVELGGRPISRLDYKLTDRHVNPAKGPRDLRKQVINGPHAHLWDDNRGRLTGSIVPKILPLARPIPEQHTDFGAAFEWFCAMNNVACDRTLIPIVPTQLKLI